MTGGASSFDSAPACGLRGRIRAERGDHDGAAPLLASALALLDDPKVPASTRLPVVNRLAGRFFRAGRDTSVLSSSAEGGDVMKNVAYKVYGNILLSVYSDKTPTPGDCRRARS